MMPVHSTKLATTYRRGVANRDITKMQNRWNLEQCMIHNELAAIGNEPAKQTGKPYRVGDSIGLHALEGRVCDDSSVV